MKSKGFGHTARGVLASVFLLAILLAAGGWVLQRAEPPGGRPPGPAARPAASSEAGRPIRVALTGQAVSAVRLRIDGPFRLVSETEGGARQFDRPLAECTVSVTPAGLEIAGKTLRGDGVEVVPGQSPSVWIDGRQYRGSVRLHVEGRRLRPVNVLPLEEYVAAVVDAEMPAAFPPAARQAQAVVARTYAVSCRRAPPHRWFDLYSTPVSQNYLGYVYQDGEGRLLAGETPAGRAAAAATAGLVCTYQGRLFRTYYSACCGGRTVSGAAVFRDGTPALQGVACGCCGEAPLYRWTRAATDDVGFDRLAEAARARLPGFGPVRSATTAAAETGAPPSVELSDGHRTVRVSAAEVKSALALPSLLFDLSGGDGRLLARGRGHGHAVGLCQWGAKGLAGRGLTAEQILKHYYPGCELTRLE